MTDDRQPELQPRRWWQRHRHVYDIDTGKRYTKGRIGAGGRSASLTIDEHTEWLPVMACACGKVER